MEKKKLIAGVLALSMLLMTACGDTDKDSSSVKDTAESTQPVTTAAESVADTVTNDTTSSAEETTTETASEPDVESETETTVSVTESATESETESGAEAPAEGKHLDVSFSDIDAAIDNLSTEDNSANDTLLREMFDIDFDPAYVDDEDDGFRGILYNFSEPTYIKDLDLMVTSVQTAISTDKTGKTSSSISIYFDVSNEGEGQTVNSLEKIEKIEACFFGHEDVYTPTGISASFEHISAESGASFTSALGHSVDLADAPTDWSKLFVTFSS